MARSIKGINMKQLINKKQTIFITCICANEINKINPNSQAPLEHERFSELIFIFHFIFINL